MVLFFVLKKQLFRASSFSLVLLFNTGPTGGFVRVDGFFTFIALAQILAAASLRQHVHRVVTSVGKGVILAV